MVGNTRDKLPLHGVKVVDFGQYIAGPAVAMILGDLGATVVHIDPPGGPLWQSPANATLNRNKLIVTIDLKSPEGLEQALALIAEADIVIENFRPGKLEALKIDFAVLRQERPELITLSIPGFASNDEERRELRAYESIIAASSGVFTDMGLNRVLMGVNPSFSPLPLASAYGAMLAASAAVLALQSRERTGLGMMECKNALVEAGGDIEKAIDDLRKSGQAKAAKKAGRTAAEGAVGVAVSADGKTAIMVEINSETDFVARDENFLGFVAKVANAVLAAGETDAARIAELPTAEGPSVEVTRQALVQKIGENIQVRRAELLTAEGAIGAYVHGGKIGVLVALKGGSEALGKDVAMHVAATNPMVVSGDQVPADVLEKEKEIIRAQPDMAGKPAEIVEKMLGGRISKFLKEVSLNDQPFVKNPDTTVGKLVKDAGAEVTGFIRLVVGEGIEKEETDFAAEVMAQVNKG